jgi:hypothetical protein
MSRIAALVVRLPRVLLAGETGSAPADSATPLQPRESTTPSTARRATKESRQRGTLSNGGRAAHTGAAAPAERRFAQLRSCGGAQPMTTVRSAGAPRQRAGLRSVHGWRVAMPASDRRWGGRRCRWVSPKVAGIPSRERFNARDHGSKYLVPLQRAAPQSRVAAEQRLEPGEPGSQRARSVPSSMLQSRGER